MSWRRHRTTRLREATARATVSCCALTLVSPLLLDYVVEPGDTVSVIAARHGATVAEIVRRNDLSPGGHLIQAGQRLRIPAAHRPGHRPAATRTRSADGPQAAGDGGRRRIVWHRVRPGDTMTGIAVRYHAWTAELVEANGGSHTLLVGDRVKVPVVVSRARREDVDASGARRSPAQDPGVRRLERRLSRYADPDRGTVRRLVQRTAQRHGVDPELALAVSWQEAGWSQQHVSADRAIGAMQVIPTTGEWVSGMVGRDLELLRVRDNVTAGVVLLDHLTDNAGPRRAVAGYYQGLAGVREHGMYDDTVAYVDNVLALQRAFEQGDYPG